MKFGLSMFGYGPRHYPGVAQAAEANGFESVWMSEHIAFPELIPDAYPYTDSGTPPVTSDTPLFDPWIVLAAVAQATQHIRLGTSVYILPLRHPLITARTVVTLDHLSNGRVILGVGVGWLEDEFILLGESFNDRGRRTDEIIHVLRRLWTEDVIEHYGEHLKFGPLKFQPKPRHGTIPIEVGGTSRSALRRAGALGDGWIEAGTKNFDELAERLAVVRAARREAGRDHLPFEVSVVPGRAEWGHTVEGVGRLADQGVTRVIVRPNFGGGVPTVESTTEWITQYGDKVIGRVG